MLPAIKVRDSPKSALRYAIYPYLSLGSPYAPRRVSSIFPLAADHALILTEILFQEASPTINMASMAPAARDIQATSGRDNLTAVAAKSVPVTRSHPLPLPTPPNSISPGLPPHGLRAQLLKASLEPSVPHLDLDDSSLKSAQFDTAAHPTVGSPPDDPTGSLTPAMLAKYHLPEILLNHGPLAIRYITGYLTSSVPGFAAVPPAKARRLVVGALEGRGSGGMGGGVDGDVIFEKVGWGRWDARRRGQPSRDAVAAQVIQDASTPYMSGIPIAGGATWSNERTRIAGVSSSRDDSPVFSHGDRGFFMHDDPADQMSLDGDASSSEAPDDDDDVRMDDPEDVTDEEDWAAIGAAGLRADSYAQSAGRPCTFPTRFQSSGMAKAPKLNDINYAALAATPDAQERDAIEALLRLGSV